MNLSLISYDDRKTEAPKEGTVFFVYNQVKCLFCGEPKCKEEMHSEKKCKDCKHWENEYGDPTDD